MYENDLRVSGSGTDQHSGDNIGQQGQEKKAPVRKYSLVTIKNPLRKTSFVSFDENITTIGTQDTSEDNEDNNTENAGTQQSSKKAPNDGRLDFLLKLKLNLYFFR